MQLNDWYDKGLTPKDYMEQLEKHRDGFMKIYNEFTLPDDQAFFKELKERNLRAVVLAEVWCGHCMLNIPILLNLAITTDIPVRFLPRDENLELMDHYLTNGKSRTIPIMIFIDENGQEVAKWGPLAPKTKAFVDELKADFPEKGSPTYDEKFQEMIQATSKEFTENENLWNAVYQDMKQTLS